MTTETESAPLEDLPDAMLYGLMDGEASDDERRAAAKILDARHNRPSKAPKMKRAFSKPEDELGGEYRPNSRSKMDEIHADTRARNAARWNGNLYVGGAL